MGRRRQASAADDLLDLVAMLPWWAGVALALLSYFLLHAVATAPLPVVKSAVDLGQVATAGIWRSLAYAGQFVLPLICLLGALISALRGRSRRALHDAVSKSSAADALEGMSWHEFELLVGEGFRRQGYAVSELGGGGADGGVDLVLKKMGDKILVQCKQWKAFKVGVSVVRELYGVMAAQGAARGFVVTSGRFTEDAAAFANGRNIHLINGEELIQLIRNGKATKAPASVSATLSSPVPTCPVCNAAMVRRVAKRGRSAGNGFWGAQPIQAARAHSHYETR